MLLVHKLSWSHVHDILDRILVYALKHMVDIRPTESEESDQEGMLELADIMKYT